MHVYYVYFCRCFYNKLKAVVCEQFFCILSLSVVGLLAEFHCACGKQARCVRVSYRLRRQCIRVLYIKVLVRVRV